MKRIDKLGRIVVPVNYLKSMGISRDDEVEIYCTGDEVYIRKYNDENKLEKDFNTQVTDIKKQIEECDNRVFKPSKFGEKYYTILSNGDIFTYNFFNSDIDKEFINQFDIEDFVNELKKQYGLNNKDKIIFTIIGKLIQFYKMSQVYVFGINGYEKIYVDMNINTCEICKNRFKDGIDLTKDIDETIFHPYCKTVFKGEKNEKINK